MMAMLHAQQQQWLLLFEQMYHVIPNSITLLHECIVLAIHHILLDILDHSLDKSYTRWSLIAITTVVRRLIMEGCLQYSWPSAWSWLVR
jgi:hypothetical protein